MPFRLPRLLSRGRRLRPTIQDPLLGKAFIPETPLPTEPPPTEAIRLLLERDVRAPGPRGPALPESPLEVLDRRLRSSVYEDPTSLPLPEPLPEPDPRQLPLVELPGTTQPLMVETAGARTLHDQPLIPMLPLMIRDEEIRRALSHPVQEIPSLDPAATDALLQNPEPSQLFMPSPKPGLPLMLEPPPSGPAGQLRFLARPGTMETPEGEIRPTDQPELYVPPLFSGPEPEIPPQPPLNRGWDEDTVGALPGGKLSRDLIKQLKERIPQGTEPQMEDLAARGRKDAASYRIQADTDALIAQHLGQALRRATHTPWQSPITAEQAAAIRFDLEHRVPQVFPSPLPPVNNPLYARHGVRSGVPIVSPLQRALYKIEQGASDLTGEEQYHLMRHLDAYAPEPTVRHPEWYPNTETVLPEPRTFGAATVEPLPPDISRKVRGSLGAEGTAEELRGLEDRVRADPTFQTKTPTQQQATLEGAWTDRWFADWNPKTMPPHDRAIIALLTSTFKDQPQLANDLIERYSVLASKMTTPAERIPFVKDVFAAITAAKRVTERAKRHTGRDLNLRWYPSDVGAEGRNPTAAPSLYQTLDNLLGSFWSAVAPLADINSPAILHRVKEVTAGVPLADLATDARRGIQEPGDAFSASPQRVTLDQQRRRQNPDTGEWYDAPMGVSPYENVDEWPSMPRAITGTPGPPPVGLAGDLVRLREAVGDVPAGTVGRLVSVTGAPDVEQGARLRFEEGGLGPSLEQQADRGPNAAINFAYREPGPEGTAFEIVPTTNPKAVDVVAMRAGSKHMNNTRPGEPGWLGNPYRWEGNGGTGPVQAAIERFRQDFLARVDADPEFRQAVLALKRVGYRTKQSATDPNAPTHVKVIQAWQAEQLGTKPPSELVPIARIELEDGRQIQVPHTQVENTFAPRRSDQPPIAATPRRGGTAAEWRAKRDERRLTAETQLTATALQKAGDPDRYMQMAPSIELFKRLLSAVERRKNLKAGLDPLGRPRPDTGPIEEPRVGWARRAEGGYEVSTKGDKTYSAKVATLKGRGNRTIDDVYFTDVKGSLGRVTGKGRYDPAVPIERYYEAYKNLWREWAAENPTAIPELYRRSQGAVLTDMFAKGPVSQARALSELLGEWKRDGMPDEWQPSLPKALPEPAPKKKGTLPLAGLVGAAGASLLAGAAGQPKKEDQGMWGQQLPELEGVEPTEAGLGGGFSRMLAKMMQRGAQALDSSVLEEIRQEQMAPVVRKSTQQMPTRLKDRFVGEHEYLEDTGRSIEKNLRKAGKYVSQAVLDMLPHRQIPVNVRGGMGEAHQSAARIGQTLTSMSTQTLDKTRAYLNTLGYEREWDLVERKIADADAQYAALMAKGDAKGAQTVLKAAADLRRAVEDRTVVPKGLTKAQVLTERQRLLRGMTPQERTQVTNATWTIFKEIQDGVDALFTEGGIDPAVYQEWKKRGPEYFPLHRLLTVYDPKNRERLKPLFLGAPEGTRAARVRLGVAHSSLLDPEMRGSKLVNVDPLEGTAHILEGLHNDVRRLRVAKNVLRSLDATQQFASPDLQLFVRRSYEDEPVPEGYGKVAWLDNNIPQYYLVNKDLERGFAALDAGDIVDAVEIAATTRRLYHSMAATANLRFMVKQMVIDPVVMSFLPHYGKYSGRNWMPAIETAWPTYVRGWMAMYPGKLLERMGSPFQLGRQRYLNEVRKSGFYESGAAAQPLGVRGSLYRDMVGPWESEFRKSSHKGTRAWRYGLEAIQEIGLEPNELAVKYAGYKTLRKEGYGPMEAAAETRAYVGSPDFNKWGWMTRKYGKNAFMFIGPTISGMHRIARRIHETPDKMAEFVLGAMLVELAADQWNDQFKDANGVSPTAYADRRTRAQNVMIVDPEKKPQQLSNGDLRWPMIKIPKPPEMVALQAPVMAIKFAMEDQDYTALQGFAHIIEQWIPGGGSLEGKDVGSLGYSVVGRGLSGLNPLYRVLPEQLVGEGGWNFTLGAPIVGTRTQGKIPELQFTPYTDPTIKALSRGISDVTKQRAPEMLRSPDRLQHLVNTFLPGLGEIALGMGRPFFPTPQTLRGVESESERTVHRPIIGPITRTFYDPGTQNQQRADDLKKLFSKADETGTAQETINRLITTGNVEEFQRVPPELFQRATENQGIAALQRELSQINTLRETVLVNPDYTPEQRRQALADLWALERDLLHRLSIWTPQ